MPKGFADRSSLGRQDAWMWRQPALFLLTYGAKSASDMCERVCISLRGVRVGPTRQVNFNYVLRSKFFHVGKLNLGPKIWKKKL